MIEPRTIREDFAGAGGASLGKTMAGIDPSRVVGIERDAVFALTAMEAGHARVIADVREVRATSWNRLVGYTAGPPCQTFSISGGGTGRHALASLIKAAELVAEDHLPEEAVAAVHDGELDERSVLVLEPLHVIARWRPQWVMLEQVPEALPIWEAFADIMRDRWNYHVTTGKVYTEEYGVPQTRRRGILMAHQDRPVSMPKPTHDRFDTRIVGENWISMSQALHAAGLDPHDHEHIRSNYGSGGDPKKRGIRKAYQPAFAVTGKVGRNLWQPSGVRVSVAEAAVLQTFPADYPWQGGSTSAYQQIGNAVPPLLSMHCTKALLEA